jgi:hypothetical protein
MGPLRYKHSARALVFVVGRSAQENPRSIEAIIQRKHGLGNHTFSHNYRARRPIKELVEVIARCSEEVFRHSRVHTTFYRPCGKITPSGVFTGRYCEHSIIKKVDQNAGWWQIKARRSNCSRRQGLGSSS